MGNIATNKLQPHPKNGYYFTDISGEKYDEIKRSIEVNGIRDAIKCTPAFTVISGHQRLRIAKDLGLTEVPVEIIDVDEWEAEYLLIAENVERRGQAEADPIKKAHIAQFLKEWWGVKRGGDRAKEQNAPLKTLDDIGEFIGEDKYTTKRILKLNDLIPQIQKLVSSGKLGTTSAEQLAYLTPEVQTALYDALGEEIGERTVAQTKQLRQEAQGKSPEEVARLVEAEKRKTAEALAETQRIKDELVKTRDELLRAKIPQVVEREVVVEKVPEEMQRKYDEMVAESRQMEQSLQRMYERMSHLEKLEKIVKTQEESPMYDLTRSLQTTNRYFDAFTANRSFMEKAIASAEKTTIETLETQLRRSMAKIQEVLSEIDVRNGVITLETTNAKMMEVISYE